MSACPTSPARAGARLLVVVSLLLVGLAVPVLPVAHAVTTPRPLNDTRPVGAVPVAVDFPIEHFGVVAELPTRGTQLDDEGPAPYGEARFRVDGRWTAWQAMEQDGAQQSGQFTGALLPVDRADAYQVRGLPPLGEWRAAAINTSDGPAVVTGQRTAASPAQAYPVCMSRADWGADETITGWAEGQAQDFSELQVMTVHHTAGSNDPDQDYAATVRAIFSYHVQSNGWSDIGYQYLVDRHGTLYEGRNAWWRHGLSPEQQTPSRSCLSAADPAQAGDGADFGHRYDPDAGKELLVTGAHTGGYNTGNAGIALMGCFDDSSTCSKGGHSTVPPAAGLRRMEDKLAKLAVQHSKDPLDMAVTYTNANGSRTMPVISGHRDWSSTACPGNLVYEGLQGMRESTADLVAGPRQVQDLAASAAGADVTLTWTADPSDRYEVYRATGAPGAGPALVHTTEPVQGTSSSVVSWTDAARPDGTYYYVVRGLRPLSGTDGDLPGVTSNQGAVTVAAAVAPPPATGSAQVVTATCTDATCAFSGSGSGVLSWDFGSGGSPATGEGESVSTTYSSAGDRTVVLTATDGSTTSTDTQPVSCSWTRGKNKKLVCTTPPPD